MSETISGSLTGSGPGTVSFSPRTDGKPGISMAGASAPAPTPIPEAAPIAPPPEPVAPPTPFQQLYPGVDPSKVEFFLNDRNKLVYREIAQEAPAEPVEAPPEPTTQPLPVPTAPDEVAQLRAQVDQQNQLVQAMLIAQAQGKPLAEVLGLATQAVEPDYSEVDMYDPAQAAKLMRDVVRAEIDSSMKQHQPALEAARVNQEYQAAEMKYRADPQYTPRMITALQLVAEMRQQGSNLSIEKAYSIASKIPSPQASPTQAQANTATKTTLTPEQQQQKADQAAKLPVSNGVRGAGAPTPPPEIARDFKKLTRWVAHQQALGNLD